MKPNDGLAKSSGNRVLVRQAWRTDSPAWCACGNPNTIVHICDPSSGETEYDIPQELTRWLLLPTSKLQTQGETLSQNTKTQNKHKETKATCD